MRIPLRRLRPCIGCGRDADRSGSATAACTTTSQKVVGGKIYGKLSSSNVDPLQAQFATCGHAKGVMKKVAQLGLEQPRGDIAGF